MTLKKRVSELSSLERFNLYYKEPEKLTKGEAFRRALWNPKTKEVFGRTASSWSKILLFYFIFYGVLAALVAICMFTFLQYINPRVPKWRLEESIIGTNPGLGFRPLPSEIESTLIWYKGTDPKAYKYWKDNLVDFLSVYKRKGQTAGTGQNIHNCDFDRLPPKGKVCDVEVKSWDPCTEENHFSYHKSKPCIFLKLNKIYGWRPDFYNDTNHLPRDMPRELTDHIRNMSAINRNHLNMIWVSCEGENPADRENIGPIDYLPYRGFPGFYYPYENAEGYLSPLVAVHLKNPKTGILINIECRAWAHNIKYDRHERMGTVHFELMVE